MIHRYRFIPFDDEMYHLFRNIVRLVTCICSLCKFDSGRYGIRKEELTNLDILECKESIDSPVFSGLDPNIHAMRYTEPSSANK